MYRILIVDDEEIITNSLVRMVQTAFPQADVYAAYSGNQALQYIQRAGFDVLVTDIQMPGMSGIELLKQVNEINPQCKTVFLSGHDDFDYAYQALQHHAVRYILKNENDEILLSTIRQCMDEIEAETRNQEIITQAQELLLQFQPFMKREYLGKLIQKQDPDVEEAGTEFARYGIRLSMHMPVLLLAGRIDDNSSSETANAVDMVVRNCLEPALHCECCTVQLSYMLWLIQAAAPERQGRAVMQVRAAAERLQRTCQQTLQVSVSFLLHTTLTEWKDVRVKASEMYHAVGYMLEPSERMAFVYLDYFSPEHWRDTGNTQEKTYSEEFTETWKHVLQGNDEQALQAFGHRLQVVALTMPEYPGDRELLMFHQMHADLIHLMIESGCIQSVMEDSVFHSLLYKPVSGTSVQLAERLVYLGNKVFEIRKQHQKNREDLLIQRIHEYILSHLEGDLSLLTISEKMYLNPSYLSRRYKEITGENLSDVITRYRIEKAKELLKDGNMRIHGIAEQVGYLSATHFIRVFRKATGMTPQEWRSRKG